MILSGRSKIQLNRDRSRGTVIPVLPVLSVCTRVCVCIRIIVQMCDSLKNIWDVIKIASALVHRANGKYCISAVRHSVAFMHSFFFVFVNFVCYENTVRKINEHLIIRF